MTEKHVLFTDTDANRPAQICDRNGQTALSQCKKCGLAESELSNEECNGADNMGYSDGPVPMALQWLESALGCKAFVWDGDQHDYAKQSVGDATVWLDRMTKELTQLRKDKLRLDYVLSFVTGNDSLLADVRTMTLAQQLVIGLDGREAVDAAMATEKAIEKLNSLGDAAVRPAA